LSVGTRSFPEYWWTANDGEIFSALPIIVTLTGNSGTMMPEMIIRNRLSDVVLIGKWFVNRKINHSSGNLKMVRSSIKGRPAGSGMLGIMTVA
jgi:hypothetical protein